MDTNEKKELEKIGLLHAIAYAAERLANDYPKGSAEANGHARQAAAARAIAERLAREYCEREKLYLTEDNF